jgi:hypothetical protein
MLTREAHRAMLHIWLKGCCSPLLSTGGGASLGLTRYEAWEVRAHPLRQVRARSQRGTQAQRATPLSPQVIRVGWNTFSQFSRLKWPIRADAASPQRLCRSPGAAPSRGTSAMPRRPNGRGGEAAGPAYGAASGAAASWAAPNWQTLLCGFPRHVRKCQQRL